MRGYSTKSRETQCLSGCDGLVYRLVRITARHKTAFDRRQRNKLDTLKMGELLTDWWPFFLLLFSFIFFIAHLMLEFHNQHSITLVVAEAIEFEDR